MNWFNGGTLILLFVLIVCLIKLAFGDDVKFWGD